MADNKEIIKCPACGEDMVKVLIPDLNMALSQQMVDF